MHWLVLIIIVLSSASLISLYVCARPLTDASAPKQRAWILTLASSLVMSTVGVRRFVWLYRVGGGDYELAWTASTAETDGALVFFVTYLALDLFVGFLDYRECIHPVSGWLHHSMYAALCVWLIASGASNVLAVFMVLELPTILISLRNIRPSLQTLLDAPFLWLFFVTRLVLHTYMLARLLPTAARARSRQAVLGVGALALAMHVDWWVKLARYRWCRQEAEKPKQI